MSEERALGTNAKILENYSFATQFKHNPFIPILRCFLFCQPNWKLKSRQSEPFQRNYENYMQNLFEALLLLCMVKAIVVAFMALFEAYIHSIESRRRLHAICIFNELCWSSIFIILFNNISQLPAAIKTLSKETELVV